MPASCDYDSPTLTYSSAEACEPELVRLEGLANPQKGNLPELPLSCTQAGETGRIVEISAAPRSGQLILHVYNGSQAYAYVQVFGAVGCGEEIVPVTKCISDNRVAFKVRVDARTAFDRYFVRVDLAASAPGEAYRPYNASQSNFVALAAYDGKEPSFASRMSYNEKEVRIDGQDVVPPPQLPVSCTGLTFHRLILSSCGAEKDLAAWAEEAGLPVSESYTGEGGSVVAADAPEGMSLQSVGGATREKRPSQDTTGTAVEPDYIISLFNPDSPEDYFAGNLRRADVLPKDEKVLNCLAFDPVGSSTSDEDQIIVSIIDSGVDYAPVNLPYWHATRYRQAKSTQLMRPGQLGFDFINNDPEPEDESIHGTFVAGAVLGGYQAKKPLTTVHFKIFGAEKAATYFGALVAMQEAMTIGSDVINMSWGFYSDERPRALECLVNQAAKRKIVLVTSAGNENRYINKINQWPASFAATHPETVVSVASYEFEGNVLAEDKVTLTSFSNQGAPDVAVAAFMTTETPNYGATGTGYFLGTSISAPIVTRTVANLTAQGRPGVGNLQHLYGRAPNLVPGEITDDRYLPVCVGDNLP